MFFNAEEKNFDFRKFLRSVYLLILLIPITAYSQDYEIEIPEKSGFIQSTDSVKLKYEVYGNSPDTLVLLHGGPGLPSNYMTADFKPLAVNQTLIIYDQRNAGRSTFISDTTQLRIADYVEDLDMVRKYFGLKEMDILGHSWGGFLAAQYAVAHPDKVGKLLLIDPGPPPSYKPYFDKFQPVKRLDSSDVAKMRKAGAGWANSDNPYKNCWDLFGAIGKGYTSNPDYLRQAWGGICNTPQDGLRSELNEKVMQYLDENYDFRDEFAGITAPTLIVYGKDDPIPFGGIEQYHNTIKNSKLRVIKNSGHFPFYEQPYEFFNIVENFMDNPEADLKSVSDQWNAGEYSNSKLAQIWSKIYEKNTRLEKALENDDPSLAMSNYTKNSIFFVPTAPPLKGKGQIAAFIKDSYDKGVRDADFQIMDLKGDQKILVESGRYVLKDVETEILDMGKYIVVWVNVDGNWKVAKDMFNTTMSKPSSLYDYN